jgi:hypothetical protein
MSEEATAVIRFGRAMLQTQSVSNHTAQLIRYVANTLNLMLPHSLMTKSSVILHRGMSFHSLNIFLSPSVKLNGLFFVRGSEHQKMSPLSYVHLAQNKQLLYRRYDRLVV